MSEFEQQQERQQDGDLLGNEQPSVNTEVHEIDNHDEQKQHQEHQDLIEQEKQRQLEEQRQQKEKLAAEIDQQAADMLSQAAASAPSAPAADSGSETNGFYVVDKQTTPVVAEADSSSSPDDEKPKSDEKSADEKTLKEKDSEKKSSKSEKKDGKEDPCPYSALCPYYFLACDYVSKVQLPASVEDLLLWKNPKVSGAVFGSLFTVLLSLACCSLLSVISSLLLLALTVSGSYRFYLAVVFRINGVQDPTFEKLSNFDVSLPADRVKQVANLLETDLNRAIVQLKSVLLWENTMQSLGAFIGLYVVYCIGSIFNMSTLLILALVAAFSVPKVYQMYKVPIDQCIVQATDAVHGVIRQVSAKVPFLNKKKHE